MRNNLVELKMSLCVQQSLLLLFVFLAILNVNETNSIGGANDSFSDDDAAAVTLKIVGGLESAPHAQPYLVGIAIREPPTKSGWCGGALIARDFVLTAAHCLKGVDMATLYIGAHNVRNLSAVASTLTIDVHRRHMLLHRQWSPRYALHDVAMIHLPRQLDLTANIQLIALPMANNSLVPPGQLLLASGWGRTSANASAPRPATPHRLQLHVLPHATCQQSYSYYNATLNLCLEGSPEHSTCRGDSGGPLVYETPENGVPTLVGLISYGRKCDSPTVLTKVAQYLDWIEERLSAMY